MLTSSQIISRIIDQWRRRWRRYPSLCASPNVVHWEAQEREGTLKSQKSPLDVAVSSQNHFLLHDKSWTRCAFVLLPCNVNARLLSKHVKHYFYCNLVSSLNDIGLTVSLSYKKRWGKTITIWFGFPKVQHHTSGGRNNRRKTFFFCLSFWKDSPTNSSTPRVVRCHGYSFCLPFKPACASSPRFGRPYVTRWWPLNRDALCIFYYPLSHCLTVEKLSFKSTLRNEPLCVSVGLSEEPAMPRRAHCGPPSWKKCGHTTAEYILSVFLTPTNARISLTHSFATAFQIGERNSSLSQGWPRRALLSSKKINH